MPAYFNSILESSSVTHEHNTRNRQELQASILRTVSVTRAIRYAAPEIIENTPDIILEKIHTHSRNVFSWYIKRHFCGKYSEVCIIQNCRICKSS